MTRRFLYGSIRLYDRAWFLRDMIRLTEAVNYSNRMKRAGVPNKNRVKILRGWTSPFRYAMRQEMKGLIADLKRSW